jgi:DNA-binding FadR family transcriptional regulator
MTVPRYEQAAAIVRDRIKAGALQAGQPAPSGADLRRATGFSPLTCRRALRELVKAGVLVPGHSPSAWLRVPGPDDQSAVAEAARALSAGLAGRRLAAGLTQAELAARIGRAVTSVGHAETGRLWQSSQFWELADKALDAGGELVRLHDAYRAAGLRRG